MDERFTMEIVANTRECRTEARIFISGDPYYEYPEPFAVIFETPHGWSSELPSYQDEGEYPWELLEDALEESADLLTTYPNRMGDSAPPGLDSGDLERWLLETDPPN